MGLISIKVYNQDAAEIKAILRVVLEKLDSQNLKITKIMAFKDDVLAGLNEIRANLVNVQDDLARQAATNQELIDRIDNGGLEAATAAEITAALQTTIDQAKTVAAIVPEPVIEPTDEETETEG